MSDPNHPTSGNPPDPYQAYVIPDAPQDDYSAQPAYPDPTSGYPPAYTDYPGAYSPGFLPPQRRSNGVALAAMIVSICSVVMCQPVGIVGAIMGHKARRQCKENNEDGEGFAVAGIVVGWISFGLFVISLLFALAWVAFAIIIASVEAS